MIGAVNLVGQRIGSYVVERELGAGGTGTVYLCQHTMIERAVAVKVLHDEQARDPDQVARFFQEAKAAAEIGHPNIIVIIDYGHLELPDGRRPYLMMESLDGQSLDKRLRKGGLSLDDITHILQQVCSALVACHGKGIIHRDLKPSNVFLCDRSFDHLFVKVLDFGTAKLTAPQLDGHKTMMGMVLGTPAYMSPEQCEGKGAIDHRSDIYSLGVMLYEMLTGTLPFTGDVGEMLLHQLFHQPQPPRERNPAIPPAWEALCMRMMEKAREDRFQSVTELAHALEDLPAHAAAYAEFRTARSQDGSPGHTLVATPEQLGLARSVELGVSADSRATMHAMVAPGPASGRFAAAPAPVDHGPAASQPPVVAPGIDTGRFAVAPTPAPIDPAAACMLLVTDPRYVTFARTLMLRPGGRWYDLFEVCQTAGVAPPPVLARADGLFVTWCEHPYHDPSLAAAIFLALRTGWSDIVLCARARW